MLALQFAAGASCLACAALIPAAGIATVIAKYVLGGIGLFVCVRQGLRLGLRTPAFTFDAGGIHIPVFMGGTRLAWQDLDDFRIVPGRGWRTFDATDQHDLFAVMANGDTVKLPASPTMELDGLKQLVAEMTFLRLQSKTSGTGMPFSRFSDYDSPGIDLLAKPLDEDTSWQKASGHVGGSSADFGPRRTSAGGR